MKRKTTDWSFELEFQSAEQRAKTGQAFLHDNNGRFAGKVYAQDAALIVEAINTPKLTAADWEEIYYALDYKLTSPAAAGDDREAKRWRAHLRRILKTIGPDGDNMTEVWRD